MINLVGYLILPLLLSGVIHHFLIIRYDLFKVLKVPVDFGFTLFGRRLFGDSKTFRGFVVMTVLSGFFLFLQSHIFISVKLKVEPFIAGSLLGLGYSTGELPTSLLKRRFDIAPGGQEKGMKGVFFYGLEQIDSVVGALIVAQFLVTLNVTANLLLFITGTMFHLALDLVLYLRGYKMNLNKPFYLKQ